MITQMEKKISDGLILVHQFAFKSLGKKNNWLLPSPPHQIGEQEVELARAWERVNIDGAIKEGAGSGVEPTLDIVPSLSL